MEKQQYVQQIIDRETGEVVYEGLVDTPESKKKKIEAIEKRKSTDEFKMYIDETLGSFHFLFYDMLEKGIPRQHITRFLYLCTYMDYDNNLVYGKSKGDKKFMRQKSLMEVLNLSKAEAYRTKKAMIENNMISIGEDDRIIINKDYCLKGKISNHDKIKNKTRCFNEGIKFIYEKATAKEHKNIAMLFELLPYINNKYNVLCSNPSCEEIKEIEPLRLTDVGELLGFTNNKSITQRVRKSLFNIKVGDEPVIIITERFDMKLITVNPRVYYKGNDINDVSGIIALFTIGRK